MSDTADLTPISDLEFAAAFTIDHAHHHHGDRAAAPPPELVLLPEHSTPDTHTYGHPDTRRPLVSCRTTTTAHTHWRHPTKDTDE